MTMHENLYNDDDRQYLQMMQDNICRMANNSANCKTWMVTIVTGILAIGCKIEFLNGWICLALVPIVVFWYLDSFYLSLERKMRNRQREFINNFLDENHDSIAYRKALYNFLLEEQIADDKSLGLKSTKNLAFSTSIYPFYLSLFFIVFAIIVILNWDFLGGKVNLIVDYIKDCYGGHS